MKQEIIEALGKSAQSVQVQSLISLVGCTAHRVDAPESGKHYLEFYSKGISLLFDENGILSSVRFYLEEEDGFDICAIANDSLIGVCLQDDPKAVICKLGPPSVHKQPRVASYNFPVSEWIRYDMDNYSFHVRFNSEGKGISRISYMRSDVVPR